MLIIPVEHITAIMTGQPLLEDNHYPPPGSGSDDATAEKKEKEDEGSRD